jgi:peptidoglycan hydrolase-like protein with peptidoglycan-binding domain
VARVSYLRPALTPERAALRTHKRLTARPRRFGRGPFIAAGILLVVVVGVLAAGALVLVSAKASLTSDSDALASIGLPLGGGKVQSVVVTGPHSRPIPFQLRGQKIWPSRTIPAHTLVSIDVVVKRPGWVAWLAGKTQHLRLRVMTPSASLLEHYQTLRSGEPLTLRFKEPVRVIEVGAAGHATRRVLRTPLSVIKLHQSASAGTVTVAAQMRAWETSPSTVVSWFPAGAATAAVAVPAPGSQITSGTPITLTFSKPVATVLGNHRPPVTPATAGTWRTLNTHTIQFQPSGFGYGLAAKVAIALPNDVRLVGGQSSSGSSTGDWTVPSGSTLRLQQLLAELGYLPYNVHYRHSKGVQLTPAAQETAAVDPPAADFVPRYGNVPSQLAGMWQPGTFGELTKGAIMAFENNHNLNPDGVAGQVVWRALMNGVINHQFNNFYTFVTVSEGSPETESTWHNGKTVESGLVNTGVSAAPTAQGVFAVFEHALSVTMSGYNPDGSHYVDPGIPFVSYFNGGDALHYYARGGYGYPQSDGCVEMPYDEAQSVYPYTPIGTIVDVT